MTEKDLKERFELWFEERYGYWPDFTDPRMHELLEAFKAGVMQTGASP